MSSDYFERGRKYMSREGPGYDPEKGIKEFTAGAADGSALCMWALGVSFERGIGVKKDPVQSEHWYEMSARIGFNEAQYSLGSLLQGLGRNEEAFEWFGLAAADKHDLGLLGIGICRHYGTGCQVDLELAEEAYLAARVQGSEEAGLRLAILYAERGDESSIEIAREMASECSEPDSARLWLLRRDLLMRLEGSTTTPTAEALEAAMHAADMGDAGACEWCGECLARGTTGLLANEKAHQYLDIAIANGRTRAMITKGIMLANGQGVPGADQGRARELIEAAAQLGDADATAILGQWKTGH